MTSAINNTEINNCRIFNLQSERLTKEANNCFICYRDFKAALKKVNEAIELDSFNSKALLLKGNIFLCIDNIKESVKYFNKALEIDKCNADIYGSKASALDSLNQYEAALECSNNAFEYINVKDETILPALYDQKISLLMKMKRFKEAKLILNECSCNLSYEDSSYLTSCYAREIEKSAKKQVSLRKRKSIKVV